MSEEVDKEYTEYRYTIFECAMIWCIIDETRWRQRLKGALFILPAILIDVFILLMLLIISPLVLLFNDIIGDALVKYISGPIYRRFFGGEDNIHYFMTWMILTHCFKPSSEAYLKKQRHIRKYFEHGRVAL